jgi:hypothetical protein
MKQENFERQNGDIEKTGEADAVGNPDLVWWDGPHDPNNPLNSSSWSKTIQILLIATVCFVTPLLSSIFAPGVPGLMREFHNTGFELGAFVVSIYVLGIAFGPIFLAPLSETYRRQPIYHVGNSLFVVFSIACALTLNLKVLIIMRFMEGIFGRAPLKTVCLQSSASYCSNKLSEQCSNTVIALSEHTFITLYGSQEIRVRKSKQARFSIAQIKIME